MTASVRDPNELTYVRCKWGIIILTRKQWEQYMDDKFWHEKEFEYFQRDFGETYLIGITRPQ